MEQRNLSVQSRRQFLRRLVSIAASALGGAVLASCRRAVEIEGLPLADPSPAPNGAELARERVATPRPPITIRRLATPTPLAPAPAATVTPVVAARAPVVLRADALDYGWTRLAQEMTPSFEETFPHIRLEWRSLSNWRDYPGRVASLRASGLLGDLIESPTATLTATWAQEGLLADLSPLIEADGYDTGDHMPSALAAYQWQGQQVGLPLVAHGGDHVVLYDRDLLGDLGESASDAERSLENLTQAIERMAEKRGDIYGLILSARLPGAYPLLRAFGTDLLDPTGGRCIVDEPAGRACLDWIHHQVRVVGSAPAPLAIERGPTAMWQARRAALFCTSLRGAVALRELQARRAVGAMALPAMPEVAGTPALASGVGYCVPATSRHTSEAFQWIKFMLSSEIGVRMFAEGYAEPGSRVASWQDPRVLARFPYCAKLVATVAHAEPERVPNNLATEQCYRIWNEHVSRMLAGALLPEQAAALITADVNTAIGAADRRQENQG